MRRMMLAAAILTVPLATSTAGLIAAAGPAGASPPVSCTKVTGSLSGTVTFKGCSTKFGKGSAQGTAVGKWRDNRLERKAQGIGVLLWLRDESRSRRLPHGFDGI